MTEFKPNSHKYKEKKEKNLKPVVSGQVSTRKKPIGKKVAETMLGTDIKTAKTNFINDFIIPSIRDLIQDGFHSFIDALFGGGGYRSSSYRSKSNTRTSYEKYYYQPSGSKKSTSAPSSTSSSRSSWDIAEVVFEDRKDADDVLKDLRDIINEYGSVSLNDYYELVGKTNEFGSSTDPDNGWTNLDNVSISIVRNGRERGHIINLPRPEALN